MMLGRILLYGVFFIYAVCKFSFTLQFKKLDRYFYFLAFSGDQDGNVWGGPMMNDCLLKKGAEKVYGNPDETISHATGISKKSNSLNKLGLWVAKKLNKAEKEHVEKAAEANQDNTKDDSFILRKGK